MLFYATKRLDHATFSYIMRFCNYRINDCLQKELTLLNKCYSMRKAILQVVPLILLAWALVSCSSRVPKEEPVDNAEYSSSNIMQLGATDYDAAIRLTDVGLNKGALSVFKANELKANLTYQFTEDYALAASYLHKAMEQEEAKDPEIRTDLLYHLATIHRTAKEFPPCLSACTEGREIAHSIGRTYDEHAFDFLAGSCLWSMGEAESGMKQMKDAIAGATVMASSEAEYGHLAHFTCELLNIYVEAGEYESALEQCGKYEQLLTQMQKSFPETPTAFMDRSWFYLDMNRSVCYARTGERAKAADAFTRAQGRRFAESEGGILWQVQYYAAIGDPENVLRIYTETVPYTDQDTVTRQYRYRLARIRDAYRNAGMADELAAAEARYNVLSELLEARENAEGLPEKAARYDAQNYRLQLGDTLKTLAGYRSAFIILGLLILTSLVILILLNRRNQIQNRELADAIEKDIRSLRRQVSIVAERELRQNEQQSTGEKLSLTELIEGRQLYLNKNLNKESAAALLGLSQAEMSRMLQDIQPGLSFPDYIKGLRLRHAIQLLGDNPDIAITDLADRCGFYSVRTLQRSFLTLTGKTPSEYAKELKNK